MARPVETTTLRMNRPLGRLRLLTEASAIILTKRRPPRIDAGGRRLSEVLFRAWWVDGKLWSVAGGAEHLEFIPGKM